MSVKNKFDHDKREKYWNEDYVRYWKNRVEEANDSESDSSRIVKGDVKTTTNDLYVNAVDLLQINKSDNVLEIGCGFGRSLPMLCENARHVTAVDISEQMIAAAKESCNMKNLSLHVSPSEELPFTEDVFDVIVCFAAFDAMYQTDALIEMNRVCKKNARVLVTGKNDNYLDEDDAALEAEIGARAKKHPKYFTDVQKFIDNIGHFGFELNFESYYQKRGDFTKELKSDERPEKFYEYLFVLRKVSDCAVSNSFKISDGMSKSFTRHQSNS